MAKHALLIGLSKFDDPTLSPLKAPADDVRAFAEVLQDSSRGGFDSVTTSLDEDIETIRGKVSDLMDEKRPKDSVLLYYSGHGINAASGQLFLATQKTIAEKPRLYSLAASEIRDMMADSRAGQLILIFDCCHSGAFMEGAKGAVTPVSAQTFSAGDGAEGEYVLMSCNAMQVSLDGDAGTLSRFTSWMVDGLAKGDAAPDQPEITLDDLYGYLCRRARAAGSVMTPQRLIQRNAGVQVIARNPSPTPPELPAEITANLADPEWGTRLKAVDALDALARQDRMRPLVRDAVTTRLAVERDRAVSDALETLLAKLRARDEPQPPPSLAPEPPRAAAAPPPEKPPEMSPEMPMPAPPVFGGWEAKVLQRAGLSANVSRIAFPLLESRAKALRNATWNWWSALASIILLPAAGWSISQSPTDPSSITGAWTIVIVCFVGAALGLFMKPAAAPPLPDGDATRIAAAVPVVRYLWRDYEAKLFRRSCWLILLTSVWGIAAAAIASATTGH